MRRWIFRVAIGAGCLFGLLIALGWLVFTSSLFSNHRLALAARLLSDNFGAQVKVDGDVRLSLGRTIRVYAAGVSYPSLTMPETQLMAIKRLEFDLDLQDLLRGRVDMQNIELEGLQVNLLLDADGKTSWSKPASDSREGDIPQAATPAPDPMATPPVLASDPTAVPGENAKTPTRRDNFIAVLTRHVAQISDVRLLFRNAKSGFEFDFLVKSLALTPMTKDAPFGLSGSGTVNGEPFDLHGTFPDEKPFLIDVRFSGTDVTLNGVPDPGGIGVGYTGRLNVEVADLGELLQVMKLQRSLEGSGRLAARLQNIDGLNTLSDLDAVVSLNGGQSIAFRGGIHDLSTLTGSDLGVDIKLYPDAAPPKPAVTFRDLKLTRVVMQISDDPHGGADSNIVISTNGFDLDVDGLDSTPIVVNDLIRTPDGRLQAGHTVLRLGPRDAPVLVLEGSVGDVLRFRQFDLHGHVVGDAAKLLKMTGGTESEALGQLVGDFKLGNGAGPFALTDLTASSSGTRLWKLTATGSDADLSKTGGLNFNLSLDIFEAEHLLRALGLDPVDVGAFTLKVGLTSAVQHWIAQTSIVIDRSRLDTRLDLRVVDGKPVLRGGMDSDAIRVSDMGNAVAAALELASIGRKPSPRLAPAPKEPNLPVVQPLVLPKPSVIPQDRSAEDEKDRRLVQPLVLPKGEATGSPTMVKEAEFKGFDKELFLRTLDLDFGIDIRKIVGVDGVSAIKSDLVMQNGKARLGPLRLAYGGGSFDLSGSMNVVDRPDILNVTGATRGWDFGKILRSLKVDFPGRGVLSAKFAVSGNIDSVAKYLRTMSGSATITMRNGAIATSLLDLAGLGVLPWLFSNQRLEGYVNIVCVNAPLKIKAGRVSFSPLVVETDQVQLVANGSVDIAKNRIYLEGRPRRVGAPLSRSPWPFTLAGSLNNPDVKVKNLPFHQRRSDGARQMPAKRTPCVPDILQLR